jgi:hypothetical protein
MPGKKFRSAKSWPRREMAFEDRVMAKRRAPMTWPIEYRRWSQAESKLRHARLPATHHMSH